MNLFEKSKENVDVMANILKRSMCMNCTVHAWDANELKELWNQKEVDTYCPSCWNYTFEFYKKYLLASNNDEILELKKHFKELQKQQREKYNILNKLNNKKIKE
jgi:hypothetical protein